MPEVAYLRAHHTDITTHLATLDLTPRTTITDAQYLRTHFGDYGRAVMELGRARHTTRTKLPPDWLMCHESAQQATPMPVADIRAARIRRLLGPTAVAHDVTCSIGTEGHAIHAAGLTYIGSDIDPARVAMARHNLGPQPALYAADALRPATTHPADVIIADPARRQAGRRITNPEHLLPPLSQLTTTYPHTPMAIKCAPGLDFHDWDGLVSLVSVDGGVKEACLYSPTLADNQRREAVIIRTGQPTRVITDQGPDDIPEGPPGTYIIDPDGAIVRAGLVRHYGYNENLWMLDHRIAYLTGAAIPAGTSGFRYRETVPLKKLKSALHAHDCAVVEILVRGVDIDPDQLRKKLRLTGAQPLTIVCTRIGRSGVALICGPRESAPQPSKD